MKTIASILWFAVCLLPQVRAQSVQLGDAIGPDGVEKNKQTILSRLRHEKPTFRGDKPGEIRLRWEWYDHAAGNYIYEKNALLTVEAYARESRSDLRVGWMYNNMKVTFQEIFGLGPENDDKLIPILSHRGFLEMVPNATLAGLTLRGKGGEVKGVITRKYKSPTIYGPLQDNVEYKAPNGKTVRAFGASYDAFTVSWKDLRDRVADEVSQEKAIEDLQLVRDALYPETTDEKEK